MGFADASHMPPKAQTVYWCLVAATFCLIPTWTLVALVRIEWLIWAVGGLLFGSFGCAWLMHVGFSLWQFFKGSKSS